MFFLEINTTLLHFCYKPFLNLVCTESNDFGNLFNRNSLLAHSNRRILSLAFTPFFAPFFTPFRIARLPSPYTFLSLPSIPQSPCISPPPALSPYSCR